MDQHLTANCSDLEKTSEKLFLNISTFTRRAPSHENRDATAAPPLAGGTWDSLPVMHSAASLPWLPIYCSSSLPVCTDTCFFPEISGLGP